MVVVWASGLLSVTWDHLSPPNAIWWEEVGRCGRAPEAGRDFSLFFKPSTDETGTLLFSSLPDYYLEKLYLLYINRKLPASALPILQVAVYKTANAY